MKTQKIVILSAIPLLILAVLWITTQAFHMLSAKSDTQVLGGVVLLCITFFFLLKSILYIRKKLF
ncbi:hypothetical protein Q763_10130 [Flavobacterium beibuense F44-8]|uniref:Uncharacterized protein n=1 Tax=Flavobacterium beibuense F44-8 TaxID=1406840 RepID=A0A0A2LNH0_9FLAO|nr:hypothetical protein [Flavobacterium beibuense]KGO80876.1 hypothetical protein Q763_10130 [Flavobacterium beibuense F44-8]